MIKPNQPCQILNGVGDVVGMVQTLLPAYGEHLPTDCGTLWNCLCLSEFPVTQITTYFDGEQQKIARELKTIRAEVGTTITSGERFLRPLPGLDIEDENEHDTDIDKLLDQLQPF